MAADQHHSLLSRVEAFILQERLFVQDQPLLLAVSGGLDSVVLCDIMHRLGRHFHMAHVNFHLRGDESNRDEQFVRTLGDHFGVPVHVHHAETAAFAMDKKLSIQEAARVIRYNWFNELMGVLDMEYGDKAVGSATQKSARANANSAGGARIRNFRLLTAHHLDDNIETVLMNFFKGTGISGMRGMLPATESVARPLLFARKSELEFFAKEHGLHWVEDSSNRESKYSRNFVRHQIIPEIEKLYPQLSASMAGHIHRFRDMEKFMDASLRQKLRKWILQKEDEIQVPVNRLLQEPGAETILYGLISPFGFSPAQVPEVMHLLDAETGKQVLSGTHRIFRNRAWLIIAPVSLETAHRQFIESLPASIPVGNGIVEIDALSGPPDDAALKMPHVQYLDARHVQLPLLARPWQKGDYFYPLGMQKKKKLARFFIDAKLSATQKEKQWVIESAGRILVVPGLRIDNRFRITPCTQKVIRVRFRSA